MNNPYDQFDAPTPPVTPAIAEKNPYDQFDAPTPPVTTAVAETPPRGTGSQSIVDDGTPIYLRDTAKNLYDQFDTPPAPQDNGVGLGKTASNTFWMTAITDMNKGLAGFARWTGANGVADFIDKGNAPYERMLQGKQPDWAAGDPEKAAMMKDVETQANANRAANGALLGVLPKGTIPNWLPGLKVFEKDGIGPLPDSNAPQINPTLASHPAVVGADIGGTITAMLPSMVGTEGLSTLTAVPKIAAGLRALKLATASKKLLPLVPMGLQIAAQSADDAYGKAQQQATNAGMTPEDAEHYATAASHAAALDTLPGTLVFGMVGAGSNRLMSRLSNVYPVLETPFARGLTKVGIQGAGNVAASTGLRVADGGNATDFTGRGLGQDFAWALMGGKEGYDEGKYIPTAKAIMAGDHPEVQVLNALANNPNVPEEMRNQAAMQADALQRNAATFLAHAIGLQGKKIGLGDLTFGEEAAQPGDGTNRTEGTDGTNGGGPANAETPPARQTFDVTVLHTAPQGGDAQEHHLVIVGAPNEAEARRTAENEVAASDRTVLKSTAVPVPQTFVPSAEWQEVPAGVAVPPGGEYRMDMAAGKTFARWTGEVPRAATAEPPAPRAKSAAETFVDEQIASGKAMDAFYRNRKNGTNGTDTTNGTNGGEETPPSAPPKMPKTRAELAAESEYRAQLEAEAASGDRGTGVQGTELLKAVRDAGGLPSKSHPEYAASGYRGELDHLMESSRGAKAGGLGGQFFGDMFRTDAPKLDALTEHLRDAGFDVQTPTDTLDLIDQRLRSGRPMYGMETAGIDIPFSTSPGGDLSHALTPEAKAARAAEWQPYADNFMRQFKTPLKVQIVPDIHAEPDNAAMDAARAKAAEGNRVHAFLDAEGGRVVVVGANVRDRAEMYRKITHEMVGHYGVEQVFGKTRAREFQRIMDGLWNRFKGEDFGADWKDEHGYRNMPELEKGYGHDSATPEGRAALVAEHLGRIAEGDARPTWYQRTVATLRDWLRKAVPSLAWSDNDVHAFLDSVRRNLAKGSDAKASGGARFAQARVGMQLRDVGTDFPRDEAMPDLMDVSAPNLKNLENAANIVKAWPQRVVAGDRSIIELQQPPSGRLSEHLAHLCNENNTQTFSPIKAKWLPMVPETLRNAAVRLVDERNGNRIYVREYGTGEKHMVVVEPDGRVLEQKAFTGSLQTQFPETDPNNRQSYMKIDWARGEEPGRSQGNPRPTPIDSTRPDARQSEFQDNANSSDRNAQADSQKPKMSMNPMPTLEEAERAAMSGSEEEKRGFVESVKAAEAVAPGVKERLRDAAYGVFTDKAAVEAAKARIDGLGLDRAMLEVLTTDPRRNPATKLTNVMGLDLINRLQAQCRFDEAAQIAQHVAETATSQGQAIQSLHLLSRLTPEGIQYYAQRQFSKALADAPEHLQKTAGDLTRLQQEATGQRRQAATDAVLSISDLLKAQGLDPERLTALQQRLREIMMQSVAEPGIAKSRLVGMLMGPGGMPEALANKTAAAAIKEMQNRSARARDAFLRNLLRVNLPGNAIPKGLIEKWMALNRTGALDDAGLFSQIAKRMGIPTLTPELAAKIKEMQARYEKQTDPELKLVAGARMLEAINETLPVDVWTRVRTIQNLGMLLNPKTAFRIVGGNMGMMVLNTVADGVNRFVVDPLTSIVTGKRTITTMSFMERMKGLTAPVIDFRRGMANAKLEGASLKGQWDEGARTMLTLAQLTAGRKFDLNNVNGQFRHVFSNSTLRLMEDATTVLHSVTDRMFAEAAFRASLHRQMAAAKYNGQEMVAPTPEMVAEARMDANKATFRDPNVLSQSLQAGVKALNRLSTFGATNKWGLGTVILPFTQVPASILYRGAAWSPAGFVRASYEILRPFVRGGEFNQKAFTDSFTRATLGTGMIALGAWLYQLGIISAAPEENREVEGMRKSAGLGGYRINLSELLRRLVSGNWSTPGAGAQNGDELLSYDWLEPAAMPLAAGADYAHAKERAATGANQGKIEPGPITQALMAGAKTLEDKPLLQGLSKVIRDVSEHGFFEGAARQVAAVPGVFVPTVVTEARNLQDNTMRETRGADPNSPVPTFAQQEINQVLAKLPWVSERFPPKYDAFGQAQERYQAGTNTLFNVLCNPSFSTRVAQNSIGREVEAVFRATDKAELPKQSPGIVTINGQQVQLTNEQLADYRYFVGQWTARFGSLLVASPEFAAQSPQFKAVFMGRIVEAGARTAKISLFGQALNQQEAQYIREQPPEVQSAMMEMLHASQSHTQQQMKQALPQFYRR